MGDDSAFEQLKRNLSKKYGLPEKALVDNHLNLARNWFKHLQGKPIDETITLKNELASRPIFLPIIIK